MRWRIGAHVWLWDNRGTRAAAVSISSQERCAREAELLSEPSGCAMQGFQESQNTPLVCLANGGGIRAALPAGNVTYGDVTTVFPFGTIIEVLAITGAQLKESLAFGVDSVGLPPSRPSAAHRLRCFCIRCCAYALSCSLHTVSTTQCWAPS